MHRTFRFVALGAIAVGGLASQAGAQTFSNGDLVLFFQNPGGSTGSDQTLYVDLGNAATVFRGAATGADVANMVNITNIGSALSSAFGSNWATATTLYAGLAAARNNTSPAGSGVTNGDGNSTVYVSQARSAVGTVGIASSSGYSGFNASGVQIIAGGIISMNNTNPAIVGSLALGAAQQFSTGNVFLDEQNPFLSPGVQGSAFTNISGGVQQAGSASSFGTLDTVSNVEFALDLYRISATTGKTGELAGDQVGVGTFEGTLVVDNTGSVSYLTTSTTAVPEPSTAGVLMLGLGGLMLARRRRKTI